MCRRTKLQTDHSLNRRRRRGWREKERERGGKRRRWRREKSWNEGERTDRRLKERADVRRGAIRA